MKKQCNKLVNPKLSSLKKKSMVSGVKLISERWCLCDRIKTWARNRNSLYPKLGFGTNPDPKIHIILIQNYSQLYKCTLHKMHPLCTQYTLLPSLYDF